MIAAGKSEEWRTPCEVGPRDETGNPAISYPDGLKTGGFASPPHGGFALNTVTANLEPDAGANCLR